MLLMLFVGVGVCAGSSVGLCVLGHFDAAWYATLSGLLLIGLLLNEAGNTKGGTTV